MTAWGDRLAFGLAGSQTITAADNEVTGDFYSLAALTDSVVQSVTLTGASSGAAAWAGISLKAGQMVTLRFSAIRLTSGTVVIYKMPVG